MASALNSPTFTEAKFRPMSRAFAKGEHLLEFDLGKYGKLTGTLIGFIESMPGVHRSAYNVTGLEIDKNRVAEGAYRVVPPEIVRSITVLESNLDNWLRTTPNAASIIAEQNRTCKVNSQFARNFFQIGLNDGPKVVQNLIDRVLHQLDKSGIFGRAPQLEARQQNYDALLFRS